VSDLLTIGSSGITAYQRALATVSNNIANISTDGYSRQNVSLSAGTPQRMGGEYLGTGTMLDGIRRQYDAFAQSNLRNSNSALQGQEPMVSYVNRVINVMGDVSIGLSSALNQFFSSARDLATDPASSIRRSTFLRDADGLASRFRQLDAQYELLDQETSQAVQNDVGKVNSLTQQLAQINRQFTRHLRVDDQPSELVDQRDRLLTELSGLTGIKTRFEVNGSVVVSLGDTVDQGVLVDGGVSREVAVVETDGRLSFVTDPYGDTKALPNILSGTIGGALAFREHVLGPAASSLDELATRLTQEANSIHQSGIDLQGRLGLNLFEIKPNARGAAAGVTLAITDNNRVAAAGQFRVIDNELNTSSAESRISYAPPSYGGETNLYKSLAQGLGPQITSETVLLSTGRAGAALSASPVASLGVAPVGMTDLVLSLPDVQAGQTLQVMTRDGRQLLGTALSPDQRGQIMDNPGMEEGANYDSTSLGSRFLGMDLMVGARAPVQQIARFDPNDGKLLSPTLAPATLQGRAVASGLNLVPAGAIKLNGVTLGELNTGAPLTATDIASWLNGYSSTTGVTASVLDGAIRLDRPVGNTTDEVRLELGAAGEAVQLRQLGFDPAFHLIGAAKDDLLVFVTGSPGTTSAVDVQAIFKAGAGDPKQALRDQALEVRFTSASEYQIVETASNSVVAERSYDSNRGLIRYRGLTLTFSSAPAAGDRFAIDANRDGVGNNEAMLAMSDLENKKGADGELTLSESYLDRVNQISNLAQQAQISRDALQVVFKQAQEARDGVAGVDLNEEAADLVRFQQAYQANAKVMQVAGTLFDTILQLG